MSDYCPSMKDDARRWKATRTALANQDERLADMMQQNAETLLDLSLSQEQREQIVDQVVDAYIRETTI